MRLAPGTPLDERTPVNGVVSHASAAVVYDVGLLDPARHEFTVPASRRVRSRRPDVTIHTVPIDETDTDWVDGLLTTTPTRLVADLCAIRFDGEHLAGVVADLLAKRLAARRQIDATLRPYASDYAVAPNEFLPSLLDTARTPR